MRRDWENKERGNHVWDVKIINKQPTNKINKEGIKSDFSLL